MILLYIIRVNNIFYKNVTIIYKKDKINLKNDNKNDLLSYLLLLYGCVSYYCYIIQYYILK